jgi:hypothetical protein
MSDLKTLNDLTAQVQDANSALDELKKTLSTQKVLEWVSLGLAFVALVSGVVVYLRNRRKKK